MAKNNPFETPLPKRQPGQKNEKPSMGSISPVRNIQLSKLERDTIAQLRKQNKK